MEGLIGEAEEDCPLREDKWTEVGQIALGIRRAGKHDSSCRVSALGFVPFVFRAGTECRASCRPSNAAASHRGRCMLLPSTASCETSSQSLHELTAAQAGLELVTLLPQLPNSWIIGLCHQAQMEFWTL